MVRIKHAIVTFSLFVCYFLTACGSDVRNQTAPAPTVTLGGIDSPTSMPILGGEAVQGRLLVVQQGTIWLWQGDHGRPLVGNTAFQPAWSPDGTRIAYVERGDSYSDLMVIDGNGTHIAQLTANGSQSHDHFQRVRESTWALYPTWSPDGTTIIFAGQYGPPTGDPAAEFNLSLYRTSANDKGQREQVLADSEAQCGRSSATSNGNLVYVRASNTQDGAQQLYRYQPGATTGEPFPGAPAESYDPAFSPDGSWLSFAARDSDRTDVWLLSDNASSTSTPLRITDIGSARAPAFSPDGKQLAFLAVPPAGKGFDLWVVDLAFDASGQPRAGTPRQITKDMGLDADSGVAWAR